jgi:hypothetical protein
MIPSSAPMMIDASTVRPLLTHRQEPHATGLRARVVPSERLDLAEEAGEIDVGLDSVVDDGEQLDELVR